LSDNSLQPVPVEQRTLTGFDLALVWLGAAIAISEVWAGGLPALTGLGLGAGLAAIVLGRLVGNWLMALLARMGARTGLPTMVLARTAFGIRGSYLPALLNVVQLIGWTAWMVFVAAAYMDSLGVMLGLQAAPGTGPDGAALPLRDTLHYVWAAVIGVLCTTWALTFAGQRWWKVVERVSIAALLVLTVAMTAIVFTRTGLPNSSGGSPLGILVGMDLVIAMSVSWLPLVADYSRFARSAAAGAAGTFWGYLLGGTWMYAVGLLVALATGSSAPDRMVVELMGGAGAAWVIAAILLVVLSTVTTTFLDIYSTVVSAQNLWQGIPTKVGTVVIGAAGTLLALGLDAHSYEPFLLAIGAVFLPAFTVVLLHLYLVARGTVAAAELGRRGGAYWYAAGTNWRAVGAWLVGFLVYDWAQGFPSLLTLVNGLARLVTLVGGTGVVVNPPLPTFAYGASLPCIAVTATTYILLMLPELLKRQAQVPRSAV
jgi:nucleobase:cation symporter-1, NCS1 family